MAWAFVSLSLLLITLPGLRTTIIFPNDSAQLILALKPRLGFDSVFIVTGSNDSKPAFEEQWAVVELYKELHQIGLSTYLSHLQLYDIHHKNGYHNVRGVAKKMRPRRKPPSLVHLKHRPYYIWNYTLQIRVLKPLIVLTSNNRPTQKLLNDYWRYKDHYHPEDNMQWLLFLNGTPTKDYLHSVQIQFGTQFLVAEHRPEGIRLTEVFNISKTHPLEIHPFGQWNGKTPNWTMQDFYKRRRNLREKRMVVAFNQNPPYTDCNVPEYPRRVGGTIGIIWYELERRLNFTFVFASKYNSNVEFDLLTKAEILIETDAAIGDISFGGIMSSSLQSFTAPLFSVIYKLFIKEPDVVELQWGSFLSPFSLQLWLAVTAILVIASICLMMLRSYHNESLLDLLSESIFTVVGVFCQQGSDTFTFSQSGRIAMLTMYVTATTLMASYTADLISTLAGGLTPLPFYDITGLIKNNLYDFAMSEQTTDKIVFVESFDPTIMELLKHNFHFVNTTKYALSQACSKKLVVIMRQHLVQSGSYEQPCTLTHLEGFSLRMGTTIIVNPHSPYRRVFNYQINQLRRLGVLHRLKHRGYQYDLPIKEEELIKVTFWNIVPLLSFLAAGMLASILFLMMECLWNHFSA